MTSLTSRKTVTSTVTARFQISGRVQTGAAALLLSVSALAMSSGTAQAQCVGAPTGGPDGIICLGAPTGVDALAGDDEILMIDGVGTGTYTGNTGNDTITLDNIAVAADYSAATIDGGADNDTIDLLDNGLNGSSIGTVLGGTGDDTITLDGAVVTGDIFGNSGSDTINLLSGTVGDDVFGSGGGGNNTITLDGATVVDGIFAGSADDTVFLLSGSVANVSGLGGNDIITLNGASVSGDISGDLSGVPPGDDTINLLSGSLGGDVFGDAGNDTITLNGLVMAGDIEGGTGDDTIDLTSGTVANVLGNDGADTITLNGATVSGAILGGTTVVSADGGDTINLLSGSAGSVNGHQGNDTITLDGAAITGNLSGGNDEDIINLLSGTVGGNVFSDDHNDTVTLDGATVTLNINSGGGDDTINLLSGSVTDVAGNVGHETITLNGATVTGDIDGGSGNEIIDLLSGLVGGDVLGGIGTDTITLTGATVGSAIEGGSGNDAIALLSGSVTNVFGDAGNDTITLDGAAVTFNIFGGSGNDTIDLLSGMAVNAVGDAGDDTLTLNGVALGGNVSGGDGNDTIDLLDGSAISAVGGTGNDTITLNGATISVNIVGGDDNDTITLLSGVTGAVNGDAGNDTITLDGASVSGNVIGSTGDDLFTLTSGSFGGILMGGTGSDTATIQSSYSLASIVGLNGGDDVSAADGWVDTLNIGASGALIGNNVINWENINVNSADLTLLGTAMTTGQDGIFGIGLDLNGFSTLDFDDGFALTGDLQINGGSTLIAEDGAGTYSISGYVINDGTIDMSDGIGPNDVLTVNGTYDTLGADLLLDAALDSTEDGDLLVLNGAIVNNGGNQTFLTITDTNPSGDPSFTGTGAGNGIPLVDNSGGFGIVDTDFVFDPFTHPTNEILKVPFVYTLNLENDDIVYLQSDVLAQIYGYAILSEMMRDQFPTLRDRLGDMRYNGYDSEGNPELGLDNAGLWARIDGSKRDIEHDGGHNTGEWNDTRGEASIGIDIPMETFGGVGVFGVSIHAVRGYADANSGLTPDPNVAEVDTTGFGGGLSFAWFPGGGFYADVQGRVTGWDADVENEARDLKQDIDGLGWGASLEVGNRFQIASNTAIIPRGQVVYTDVDFDSFKDDDGVDVSQDDSASVVIGPGVTIEQMFPDNGVAMFLDASVKHELLDESSIDASGFRFKSGLEDTWGTVSFGASLGVAEGASAYVAGDLSSPLTSTFGDSYGYGLRAGVRIDF